MAATYMVDRRGPLWLGHTWLIGEDHYGWDIHG